MTATRPAVQDGARPRANATSDVAHLEVRSLDQVLLAERHGKPLAPGAGRDCLRLAVVSGLGDE